LEFGPGILWYAVAVVIAGQPSLLQLLQFQLEDVFKGGIPNVAFVSLVIPLGVIHVVSREGSFNRMPQYG
jgi:hypothetical protein